MDCLTLIYLNVFTLYLLFFCRQRTFTTATSSSVIRLQDCLAKLLLIPKVLQGDNKIFTSNDIVIISVFLNNFLGSQILMFLSELSFRFLSYKLTPSPEIINARIKSFLWLCRHGQFLYEVSNGNRKDYFQLSRHNYSIWLSSEVMSKTRVTDRFAPLSALARMSRELCVSIYTVTRDVTILDL